MGCGIDLVSLACAATGVGAADLGEVGAGSLSAASFIDSPSGASGGLEKRDAGPSVVAAGAVEAGGVGVVVGAGGSIASRGVATGAALSADGVAGNVKDGLLGGAAGGMGAADGAAGRDGGGVEEPGSARRYNDETGGRWPFNAWADPARPVAAGPAQGLDGVPGGAGRVGAVPPVGVGGTATSACSALKTWPHWPQRAQPPDDCSNCGCTRKTVRQFGQRAAWFMG
jgi:hypothetical protein